MPSHLNLGSLSQPLRDLITKQNKKRKHFFSNTSEETKSNLTTLSTDLPHALEEEENESIQNQKQEVIVPVTLETLPEALKPYSYFNEKNPLGVRYYEKAATPNAEGKIDVEILKNFVNQAQAGFNFINFKEIGVISHKKPAAMITSDRTARKFYTVVGPEVIKISNPNDMNEVESAVISLDKEGVIPIYKNGDEIKAANLYVLNIPVGRLYRVKVETPEGDVTELLGPGMYVIHGVLRSCLVCDDRPSQQTDTPQDIQLFDNLHYIKGSGYALTDKKVVFFNEPTLLDKDEQVLCFIQTPATDFSIPKTTIDLDGVELDYTIPSAFFYFIQDKVKDNLTKNYEKNKGIVEGLNRTTKNTRGALSANRKNEEVTSINTNAFGQISSTVHPKGRPADITQLTEFDIWKLSMILDTNTYKYGELIKPEVIQTINNFIFSNVQNLPDDQENETITSKTYSRYLKHVQETLRSEEFLKELNQTLERFGIAISSLPANVIFSESSKNIYNQLKALETNQLINDKNYAIELTKKQREIALQKQEKASQLELAKLDKEIANIDPEKINAQNELERLKTVSNALGNAQNTLDQELLRKATMNMIPNLPVFQENNSHNNNNSYNNSYSPNLFQPRNRLNVLVPTNTSINEEEKNNDLSNINLSNT